jgi:hypothetical protein
VRASLAQRREDSFQNIVRPLQDIAVPEPQHPETRARQMTRAFEIGEQVVRVLAAVEFNDDPRAQTNEIHDVAPQWHLAPEAIAT